MNLKWIAVLALIPMGAWASVSDDLNKIDTDLQTCLNQPDNESTVGMKMCTDNAYQAADKALNSVYKSYTMSLKKKSGDKMTDDSNAEILKRVVKSQRAWLAFRDADSELAGTTMLGGTGEGLEILSSYYSMTRARALELDQLFNGMK